VHDPDEGVAADGTIVTGARRRRVPHAFEPVVRAAAAAVAAVDDEVELFLYGSVATGRARIGRSDVDLLTVGLPGDAAPAIGRGLSGRFAGVCRSVEIGAAQVEDLTGDGDEAYGLRVFLRHYCVQLAGPPRTDLAPAYPADRRAARGFNGDIAEHARGWRQDLDAGVDPTSVGHRLARKTLLAVAGLVSVHDGTWTTDRETAARRWSAVDPTMAPDLALLVGWTDSAPAGAGVAGAVRHLLGGTVTGVVEAFRATVGLWPEPPGVLPRTH
jgi:uncharacterized protein